MQPRPPSANGVFLNATADAGAGIRDSKYDADFAAPIREVLSMTRMLALRSATSPGRRGF